MGKNMLHKVQEELQEKEKAGDTNVEDVVEGRDGKKSVHCGGLHEKGVWHLRKGTIGIPRFVGKHDL